MYNYLCVIVCAVVALSLYKQQKYNFAFSPRRHDG